MTGPIPPNRTEPPHFDSLSSVTGIGDLLTVNSTGISASPTQLAQIPIMDQVVSEIEHDKTKAGTLLNERYYAYANDMVNGLSPMERDLLKLQVDTPFIQQEGFRIQDYRCTLELYQRHRKPGTETPQPRFQLCNYFVPKLAELENFLFEMRSAPMALATATKYEQNLIRLFNALLTGRGSLSVDTDRAKEYRDFMEKQIGEIKAAVTGGEGADLIQFKFAKLAIDNYFFLNFLPRELLRYGLAQGPSWAVKRGPTVLQRQRYLGIMMPKLSEKLLSQIPAYKTAREHNVSVYLFNSANGTVSPQIPPTSSNGDFIDLNLLGHEVETTNAVLASEVWKQRFDKTYAQSSDFKFERDPRFLDQFLLLGFHGSNSNPDTVRNGILNANLEEQAANTISRIYLENLFRQSLHKDESGNLGEDDLTFWSGLARGRLDNISALFKEKNSSTLQEAYEKIEQVLGIGDIDAENLDAGNIKRGLKQILDIEARLRAMAKSSNPLYTLLKSLRNVILPMEQEFSSNKGSSTGAHFGAEVILTKLLTEKLLGKEGEELCKSVNWDELLKIDFTKFERYSYENFLKDSENLRNDSHGLMKLRRAWYKFFDQELGGADYEKKFATLARSSKIQDAARSLIKREFTSYPDRKTSEHLVYYKKHRHYGLPDKINDMVA